MSEAMKSVMSDEMRKQVQERIELVRGWYEGHGDDAVIQELAVKGVEAEAAALTLIRQMREALKDADHLCKWLLQSDISAADRERVIRENGISFAVQIAAAEKFLEGR